jgi:AraC-like DNA-binding protein
MDSLSRILSRIQVSSGLFCRAELGAPWSLHTRGGPHTIFHVIVRGSGLVETADASVSFRAGDLIVLPGGPPHTMMDAPSSRPVPISSLPDHAGDDGLACVHHGGDGAQTSILCGTFELAPDTRDFLLPLLPPILHVAGGASATWLDQTLRMMAEEVSAARPGHQVVLAKLADLLLVQALRAAAAEGQGKGWLRALDDPQLGRVLGCIHADPAAAWTAATLAREAGMSRAAFFERFRSVVGEPPAAYLVRWRMTLAREALRSGTAGLAEVADEVGYSSEAALSRAFKRHMGISPGAWRRQAMVS